MFRITALSLLLASNALAVTATFTVSNPDGRTTYAAGENVPWTLAVDLTSDCSGLHGYGGALEVRNSTNALIASVLPASTFTPSFHVEGNGPGSLIDTWIDGGPCMNSFYNPGAPTPGKLDQMFAMFGPQWRGGTSFGAGRMYWGVGLASRKAVLLGDANADYVINNGVIPTAGLPDGTYTVRFVPSLLNALKTTQDGTPLNYDTDLILIGVSTGVTPAASSLTFVIPEPAGLLLLAVGTAAVRRRRI